MSEMRNFDTGATRNLDNEKIDYEGFMSPIVIESFGKYMHKHRVQADGKLRESDNWQKLFGEKHEDVCMKSMWRHFMDLWLFHRGYKGRETIEDAINGILFNAIAYQYKVLNDKIQKFH
jgi:hypothetical protein